MHDMKNIASRRVRKIDFHNHIWVLEDPDGDRLIEAMDKYGIEWMLLHATDKRLWDFIGDNNDVLRAVRKHPKRFVATVNLNFQDGVRKCRERIRRYADEGFK